MLSLSLVNHDGKSEAGPVKRDVGGTSAGHSASWWGHLGACSSQADHGVPNTNAQAGWLALAGLRAQAGKGARSGLRGNQGGPRPGQQWRKVRCRGPLRPLGHLASGKAERWGKVGSTFRASDLGATQFLHAMAQTGLPEMALMSKEGVRARAPDLRQFAPHQLPATRMASRTYVIHGSP